MSGSTSAGAGGPRANERTYPCLPCAELDPAVASHEALSFQRTCFLILQAAGRRKDAIAVGREAEQLWLSAGRDSDAKTLAAGCLVLELQVADSNANENVVARPFADPRFWAAFVFIGV